jgi:hypothetical protein
LWQIVKAKRAVQATFLEPANLWFGVFKTPVLVFRPPPT